MIKWLDEIFYFWKNKCYIIAMTLTAICSYGFLITHHTIGIDDTPYASYFEEGLVAVVGRWVLFLCNKVIHIAEFTPFLTDLAGVLILMAAVSVWCALLRRIFREQIPMYGYVLFSCLFLSNPLISEVFTYHLHNGVATGYLACGISLCCLWECMENMTMIWSWKKKTLDAAVVLWALSCAVFLFISLGCYESFMIVFLAGACIMLGAGRLAGKKVCILKGLLTAAVLAVIGIILRSLMIHLIVGVFRLEGLQDEAVQRSIWEISNWMFESGAFSEFAMILKRVFVMYGVFAYAYYPIKIYVISAIILIIFSIYRTVQQRDPWIAVLAVGSILVSFLLIIVEGKATLYRAAQFLPLFSAWGLLQLILFCQDLKKYVGRLNLKKGLLHTLKRVPEKILIAIMAVILFNQCADMNKWFYIDYLKYEDAKNTMNQIAYELEKSYDTDKPIIFTGTYEIPKSIIADAYVEYGSEIYYKMLRITSLVDDTLLEKFYRSYGVWVAQTPSLSVLDWGRYAFDTNEELIRFFSMHGHELKAQTDQSLYAEAEEYSLVLPSFPEEGAIVDMGRYIIVHF